ncbi:MAG: acyl-CoA dehydratase activase-related protein [bacterium]
MKIAFYNIGNLHIASKVVARKFGFEMVDSPAPNKESVVKGVSIAPEFSCLPFKVIIGTFIQALEKGADLLVIPTGETITACQTSDFALAHKYLLGKEGYTFDIIMYKSFNPKDILKNFKKYNPELSLRMVSETMVIFTQKLFLLESVDSYYQKLYISVHKKQAEKFKKKWQTIIDTTDSMFELYRLNKKIKNDYQKFPHIDFTTMLKIAVVGDIYSINENYINNKIFDRLCDLNVYPEKSTPFSILITNKFGFGIEDPLMKQRVKSYLKHNIGSFAQHTIKKVIKYAEEGYDGIIHIYPFNCMPETVVRSILPKISMDYDIPILYLSIDEQTGDAGFATRIEAFVDLITIRKNKNTKRK